MKWALLILVLLCPISTASATDYYVAPYGLNTNTGLSLDQAWATPPYAVSQVYVGDTVYILNGTYELYLNPIIFTRSGNITHPITLTAYNGTPVLDGLNATNSSNNNGIIIDPPAGTNISYINISNITLTNYFRSVYLRRITNVHVDNIISIYPLGAVQASSTITIMDANNSSLTNSNISGSGYNSILVSAQTMNTTDIIISDNTIQYNEHHGFIDLFQYNPNCQLRDISIYNNTMNNNTAGSVGIYSHLKDINSSQEIVRIKIYNNTITNVYAGIKPEYYTDSEIYNNTIANTTFGVDSTNIQNNVTFSNNTVTNATSWGMSFNTYDSADIVYSNNDRNNEFEVIQGIAIITDANNGNDYTIITQSGGILTFRYTDNTIFTEDGANNTYYYPGKSEYITLGNETVTITTTNITFITSSGYGKDIVVNTNLVNDVSNITANVSEPSTASMTFLTDNLSNTYNLYVNGVFNTSAISDSDSIVEFDYIFPSSISTYFEVSWYSTEGWSASQNVWYMNRVCTTWTNKTTICRGAHQEDEISTNFNVVVT